MHFFLREPHPQKSASAERQQRRSTRTGQVSVRKAIIAHAETGPSKVNELLDVLVPGLLPGAQCEREYGVELKDVRV